MTEAELEREEIASWLHTLAVQIADRRVAEMPEDRELQIVTLRTNTVLAKTVSALATSIQNGGYKEKRP